MYNPISDNPDDEYIELYNTGTAPVDIGGWQFIDGIDYTIPAGTHIPADGYLVIARNADRLIETYPMLTTGNTIGNYDGALNNRGERIVLAYPANPQVPGQDYIIVDEVTYGDGERWGTWTDGDGSSLELIDPHADNQLSGNWAGSIETGKSAWTTVELTGRLDNGATAANEIQVMLLDAGECLIDDVAVIKQGESQNRVANGTFESGTGGWVIQGTHINSHLETGEGYQSSRSLHIVASRGGDNGVNRVETDLTSSLAINDFATIRAKARWLSGSRVLLFRLHGNWLEAPCILDIPDIPGTPGTVNSRYAGNTGPAIHEVQHFPVLPAAQENVIITARAYDPDTVREMTCYYRIDPNSTYTKVLMNDSGLVNDAVADDGIYTCILPGQSSGTLVAFYIRAEDDSAERKHTVFPAEMPDKECLVRFGEPVPDGLFCSYKLWLTDAVVDEWSTRQRLSNHPLDGTLAYGTFRVIYNVGTRYHGSPWIRPPGNPVTTYSSYSMYVPKDDRLLGARSFFLDKLERDNTYMRERMSFWIVEKLKSPAINMRYIHMYVNGRKKGTIYSDSQHPNEDFLESWFPGKDKGDLFEIKDWFEFNDNASVDFEEIFNGDLRYYTTVGGEMKVARYRWSWDKKPRNAGDDDYNGLLELAAAVNVLKNYGEVVEPLVDIEDWMRSFGARHVVSDWDGYNCGRGKNAYSYKPDGGRWKMLQWDLDMALGASSQTDYGLFTIQDTTIKNKFYAHILFLRKYWQVIKEAVDGPLLASHFNTVIDDLYNGLQDNNVNVTDPSTVKTWIQARRNYILNQLNSVVASFAITSNNGNDFSTASPVAVIEGTAPVDVETITVNGMPYPVTWTGVTSWKIGIGLQAGSNQLVFQGHDTDGAPLSGMSDTITITCTATGTEPDAAVVINEIMYHPDQEDAEFIELYNPSLYYPVSLSNYSFSGIDYTFPADTVLAPDGYLVLVENMEGFRNAYGYNIPVTGVYTGRCNNAGETLSLLRFYGNNGSNSLVDSVTYSDWHPWPPEADGEGPSLQLIDPRQDNNRPGNWAVSSSVPYTPGRKNSVKALMTTLPELWINEVQTDNATVIADDAGDHDPWIELVSFGNISLTTSVDVIVPAGSTWKYNDTGTDLGSAWRDPDYNDNNWPSGPAQLGYGDGDEATVVSFGSDANNKQPTTYFRHYFTVGTAESYQSLILELLRDDGAIVYLNGTEVRRDNMAAGTVSYSDYASSTVAGGEESSWFESTVDGLLLHDGTNVLAVEIHQTGPSSSDISFDLQLSGKNSSSSASLADYYLSDNNADPLKWPFPEAASAPSGSFTIVWLDGEPQESTAEELHTSFRLPNDVGYLVLSRMYDNVPRVVDYISFAPVGTDRSYGSIPDGNPYDRKLLYIPTPGAPNVYTNITGKIYINEWMASNSNTVFDPYDNASDDWFELYNSGTEETDITGWILSDGGNQFTVPAGTVIPPGQFLLVWADGQTNQNIPGGDLHTGFKLSKFGEEILVRTPGGAMIDHVVFGTQQIDISEGRFPDGNHFIYMLFPATPGDSNLIPEPALGIACLLFLFYTARKYRQHSIVRPV
jgi:hypothetical protein